MPNKYSSMRDELRERKAGTFMKKSIILALAVLFASLGVGCGAATNGGGGTAKEDGTAPALSLDERADQVVSSMSLTEKVGQMVMIGVHGTDITDDSRYMLQQFHMGGVILFDRNMESQEQTKQLIQHLQKEAMEKVPLFIAVDEEGGKVARMRDALPPPPSQQSIGDSGDPALAEEWAERISAPMMEMGFNVNFAPVADVGAGRERSYSTDAETAAAFVKAAATGYEKAGLIYTLKHFPGIGKAPVDPHADISDIPASLEELEADDLIPFQAILQERDPNRYLIMMSHLRFPALDPERPASLSPAIVTGLLRDKLGYKGVIVTDDMGMGAVAKYGGFREMGEAAVKAGADIVLVCHEYANQQDAYLGILEAVQQGRISEERINESVKRIVRTKLTNLRKR